MDRDKFISFYMIQIFDIERVVEFIETVLLEYEKPPDKVKQLIEVCILDTFLLIEVFQFLKEKEQLKYNLTILSNNQNQIIKIY